MESYNPLNNFSEHLHCTNLILRHFLISILLLCGKYVHIINIKAHA